MSSRNDAVILDPAPGNIQQREANLSGADAKEIMTVAAPGLAIAINSQFGVLEITNQTLCHALGT